MEINGNLQSRRPDQSVQGPTTVCASPHNAHAENAPQARPQVIGNGGGFCGGKLPVQPQQFQPQQFFHPENVKKGNEGMDEKCDVFHQS